MDHPGGATVARQLGLIRKLWTDGADATGGGVMVVGSTPTDAGPAGGSSVTLDGTATIGNLAIGGDGSNRGHGYGGGVHIAMGAIVTARNKTAIFGNVASTAGDDIYGNGTFTTS